MITKEPNVKRDRHLSNRSGIVCISKSYLREFTKHGLDLPLGYIATDINVDFVSQAIQILITGPDLPEVDPGCQPPQLSVHFNNGRLSVGRWSVFPS